MRWQDVHTPHGSPSAAAILAVERHREHARERRLADAARPAQQVAVRDASAGDRPLERCRHVRLHGDVGEAFRTVFASESEHECGSGEGLSAVGIYFAGDERDHKDSRGDVAQVSNHPRANIPGRPKRQKTLHAAATFGVLTELEGSRPPGPGTPEI